MQGIEEGITSLRGEEKRQRAFLDTLQISKGNEVSLMELQVSSGFSTTSVSGTQCAPLSIRTC